MLCNVQIFWEGHKKIQIFWEGYINLKKISHSVLSGCFFKVGFFFQILWPSHTIWFLPFFKILIKVRNISKSIFFIMSFLQKIDEKLSGKFNLAKYSLGDFFIAFEKFWPLPIYHWDHTRIYGDFVLKLSRDVFQILYFQKK